ncbi:MAG TPA: tetratricopeptide repeat protein [Polyangium sp.]|nr:tetratricopeptide repeat protein [Polyangium sp.]
MSREIIATLFLLVLCWAAPARAESPSESAEQHYRVGVELHEAGRYEEALGHYRQSYALQRNPDVWANIIFCLIDKSDSVAAIAEFDAHVATDWTGLSQSSRKQLTGYLLDVGKILGFGLLTIETSMLGVLYLDGTESQELVPEIPQRLPAGKHVVRLEAVDMAPAEQTVEVRAGAQSLTRLKTHAPFHVEMRVSALGGFTTKYAKLDDPCSVYCLPSVATLAGVRLTLPLKGRFVAEIGLDYLHASSTVIFDGLKDWHSSPPWSTFFFNAGVVHASAGMDVQRGPLRFQWRAGAGFVAGWHAEEGYPPARTPSPVSEPVFMGVVRGRIGMSLKVGRAWVGMGAEGLISLNRWQTDEVPTAGNADVSIPLIGPHGDSKRDLGRLIVVSPELSLGLSF